MMRLVILFPIGKKFCEKQNNELIFITNIACVYKA